MKQIRQKAVSMLVILSFVLSMFGTGASVYAADVYKTDTVIEAENTTLSKAVSVTKDKDSSGGKYIVSTTEVRDSAQINTPDVLFSVDIPSEGTYGVYAKVIIATGGNDSFWYKWNENAWKDVHPNELGASYVWYKLAEETLSAGKQTFYWNAREAGAKYDCFFITSDASKVPKIEQSDASSVTVSPSSAPSQSGGGQKLAQFKAEGGSAMFEAEDATHTKLVSEVKSDSASGKKALQMAVDDRVAPSADADAGIGFEILADKSGSYSVWVRLVSTSGGTDSCWTSFSGEAYRDTALGEDSKDANDFVWKNIGSVKGEAGKCFDVRFIPRETGALFDKFVVTTNGAYIPSGEGEMPGEIGTDVTIFPEKYPKPSITPPPEHPRLMFRAQDIETIKANMAHPELEAAYKTFAAMKDTEYDGILPAPKSAGGNNYVGYNLGIIEAKAFDYAINGNKENGRQAVEAMQNYAETYQYGNAANETRPMGHIMFTAAEVYDWCHDIMTDEQRKKLVATIHSVAMNMEVGFPPSGQGAVCGHGGEMQILRDWLAFAIAVYDEYPDQYNFVGGRFFDEFVQTRNFWYPSGTHHQGSAYGTSSRHECELWSQWLIYRMSGETPYISEMSQLPYEWIYKRRPDGQLLREGDDYNEKGQKTGENGQYWTTINGPLFYSYNFYKDPILKKEFMKDSGYNTFAYDAWSRTPVQYFIFADTSVGTEDKATLPLTKYFASPQGSMVARTGWSDGLKSPDVLAYMKIGEIWGANHNHRDAGNFQIYYKGILASESGWYDLYGTKHDANYNKATVAHNTLLIGSSANPSGNQRIPGGEPATMEYWMKDGKYETGEVLAHEFGPDVQYPEYSYIAGDIAKAYDENVEEALRSMIFMPLDDANHPAAFVIFDKVTTKETGNKKVFMLHMQQEPKVDGNVSVITRDEYGYNGSLTNQTLLPDNAKIEAIGGEGKRFWLDGTDYMWNVGTTNIGGVNYTTTNVAANSALEAGWGRIEISPQETGEMDYFLNVMYVNDADKNLALEKAELIETDSVAGAKIFNRVAVFNKNKTRADGTVSFNVPGSDSELKVNVAGLEAGTWKISVNGSEIGEQIASDDGGIIYFTAPAGSYELTYVNGNKDKQFVDSGRPYVEGISIMVNGNYLYSDVAATIVDDRTLLPMRAIFEALEAEVSWDEAAATATAVANEGEIEVKITENSKTAYVNGEAVELDVPAMILNDRFVVPVRFVSESLGATVDWNEAAMRVKIVKKPYKKPIKAEEGYAQIASSAASEVSADNYDTNSWDLNADTVWSAQGEHWVNYTLDKEYTISGIEVWLNPNGGRTALFDIWTSDDGENWTKIIDCKGDPKNPDTWEKFNFASPVTTKHIRYYARGSDISMWNAVKEIRFKIAQ